MVRKIAVDIDGVLTVETEGHNYAFRTPNHKNIEKVNALYIRGHKIILFTARYEKDREVTEEWMKRYGVKYDALIMGKLQYDLLIDDKAQSNFGGLV